MSQWFKFYGQDFLTDPKMMKLNIVQKSMWIGLLCMAAGRDSNVVKFLTEDNLKILIGLDPNYDEWKQANESFKKFVELAMIEMPDKDTIVLLNFNKRQESNLTGYERVKRHREKQYVIGDNNDSVINDNIEEKRIDKNRIEEIYSTYQTLINKTSRLVDKAIDKIKTRLKNFTPEELKEAMTNFSKSPWWMEHNSGRGVAWFFNSDERIDQFLNLADKLSEDELFEKHKRDKK
jgi:hypothetical protein